MHCQAQEPRKPPGEALMRENAKSTTRDHQLWLHRWQQMQLSRQMCQAYSRHKINTWKNQFNQMELFSKWDSFQLTGSLAWDDHVSHSSFQQLLSACCMHPWLALKTLIHWMKPQSLGVVRAPGHAGKCAEGSQKGLAGTVSQRALDLTGGSWVYLWRISVGLYVSDSVSFAFQKIPF